MTEDLFTIWLVKTTKTKKGTKFTLGYDERFEEYFKQNNPKVRPTKTNVGKYLTKMLEDASEGKNGWAMKK